MFRFHLRSRFGRRLFGLSLLAALLPMAGLATFAYDELHTQLVDTTHDTLRQEGKGLGMELVSELSRRAELLRSLSPGSALAASSGFTWVGDIGAADAPIPDASERAALAQHGMALRLRADGPLVLMIGRESGAGVIAGVMDQTTLWQRDVIDAPYCVLDLQQRPFFCSPGLELPPVSSVTLPDRAVIEITVGDEDYLGSYWNGRLDGLFGATGFEVLMTVPEQTLSAPLKRLRIAFGAMFLLAIALAVALSANQIGRQMRPLETLLRGVKRLARGELNTRVEVEGDDEFALFGQTFNSMSASLQSQFNLLRLLAELDRAVLNSSERESISDTILQHVLDAIPCDGAGVLTLDDSGSATYRQAHRSDMAAQPARHVPAELMTMIVQRSEGEQRTIDCDWDVDACLIGRIELTGRQTVMFPVRADERLHGLLVLALSRENENIDAIVDAGRSLADRMAVAGSSIAWEEKLYRQSHYDTVTGLPNRMLLRDRVAQAVGRAERDDMVVSLLLINLDGFRQINEALGHAAGDAFLVESARRLELLLRPNDTIARLGGDEFALLVNDLAHADVMPTLHRLAENINHSLSAPVLLSGQEVISTVSLGISLCPDNAQDFDGLLKLADVALQEARSAGRTRFHFYSESMNSAVTGRFELAQDLRRAVANDELLLFFQPKVMASSGEVVGAEALVRWRSPIRGLIPPGTFLPVLEDIGLNAWLTGFVLDRACAQMAAWDRAGFAPIPVSVNVAPSDLVEADFYERVASVLTLYGLDADRLELEILESSEIGTGTGVYETLTRLRRLGVSIALDDFGTGYSSLVYLTEIPADVLKLDRAFIRNMVGDARQQSIVERVISLARSLGLRVVAEGVEEAAQRELLVEMQCEMIQGFLFSRPLPPEEFVAQLHQRAPALVPA
jgi:diguanylate cyclase (GGDEF)-like protein